MKNALRRGRVDTAADTAYSTAPPQAPPLLTPRLQRLAAALLRGPQTVRELERVIPSTCAPSYIAKLRHCYGLSITCEVVPFLTVDNAKAWYGRYHLAAADRGRLERLLGGPR